MARPALSADRALVVLEVLAEHAGRRFTLSELVAATGVNPSSMHALLAVLEHRGWVTRHPVHRTYGLGPVAFVTGTIAGEQQGTLREARHELAGLSARLGAEAILTSRVGDEILVVDRAGGDSPYGAALRVGQRIPLVPPLGAVFLAWATEGEVEGWLARARPRLSDAELADQRGALASVRERGYAITLDSPARRRLGDAMHHDGAVDVRLAASEIEELLDALSHSHYSLETFDDGRLYDLSMIAAPVFDVHGRVAAAVVVTGLAPRASAIEIRRLADEVRGAAVVATKRAGGEPPRV